MKFLANLAINGAIGYLVGMLVAIAIAIPIGIIGAAVGLDIDTVYIVGGVLGIICKVAGIILFEVRRVVNID